MKIKKILAFVFAVSVCMLGFVQNFGGSTVSDVVYAADTLEKDGFAYTVQSDGTVKITEYKGTETKVVTPKTIDGKNVTTIGNNAFLEGSKINEIIVSEGVTTIDDFAFFNCTELAKIQIPESLTDLGNGVFNNCENLADIVFPENLRLSHCGRNQFYGTKWLENERKKSSLIIAGNAFIDALTSRGVLKNIEVPKGTTCIFGSAFSGCLDLTKVTIPEGVTSIGDEAFFGCNSLIEVTMPNSITYIGKSAFSGCSSLTKIKLPSNVTKIEDRTFIMCENLSEIEIPASVTEIGMFAFDKCKSLIIYGYENSYAQKYATENNIPFVVIGTVSDEPGKTENDKPEYQEKDEIKYSVSDKETVEIAKYTGSDTKVVIPEKIDGKTVTSIISGAFEGCTDVSEISIPETVDYIGYNAFTGTKWLEEQKKVNPMYPVASVNDILIDAKSLGEVFDHISVVKGTRSIAGGAFENCKGVKEINIPDSVTFIGEKAFNNCTGLTKLIVPDSVTSIEKDAFAGCTKLVIYGNKNSYIEKYASENKIKFELIPEPVKGSGDINSDGKLDASDLLTVQIWFYGETKLNDAQKAAMDLNEDGKLNIVDICLLKEKLLSGK